MKNKDKFSIGDRVMFYDPNKKDNSNGYNGTTATIISEKTEYEPYHDSQRQPVRWDIDKRITSPVVKYLRKLTKLDKALK